MEVTVREARAADAGSLIAHVRRLADEPDAGIALSPGEFNLTVEEEQKILADYAASDNSVFLVAESGGQIIGALNLAQRGARRATRHTAVLGLSVRRAWRNRGVGRLLMARAVEWAKNTGIVSRVELFVFARNEVAIHLCQEFGFVIEGRRQKAIYRNAEYFDDLIMALWL